MNKEFERAFKGLNVRQLEAVKQIDGPVLVIAGPGTGKTQLLSTRVGHILKSTDTLARNILLLTFTEAGVDAMRERLTKFLGQQAYEVNISTYHAFGSEIIRRYPQYFESGLEPIDELESFAILRSIVSRLPYSNPMKYADAQLQDILGFISDAKRAILLPADIKNVAEQNRRQITAVNTESKTVLSKLGVVSKSALPIFDQLEKILKKQTATKPGLPDDVRALVQYAHEGLVEALAEVEASGKTSPITLWKNKWLEKDQTGIFIFAGTFQNQKMIAAADVYKRYQGSLKRRRLYDYDDMILRAIGAMQKNPELKYNLAEQYLYIMLDEFQDTNPAQMKLIELLTDHPVLEGQPNVLAVGDDDQAIYAFQGADHANMAEFARHYREVRIVSLSENYRSSDDVLAAAQGVIEQVDDRLVDQFEGVNKNIVAADKDLPKKQVLQVSEFKSDAAQYEWVAEQIKRLNEKDNIELSEVAILAPRHRNLMPLLPYLAKQELPVRYERRDNILDAPLVRQLEQMSRLTLTLATGKVDEADNFWPEVISYDFWGLKTEDIWKISWLANKSDEPWTQTLLKNARTKPVVLFFLRLKDILSITTLEQQLDILVGIPEISLKQNMPVISPFFEHYFGVKAQSEGSSFIELLGQLTTLRRTLNERRRIEDQPLGLADFINFVDDYRAAGLNVLDTNAYKEAEQAVNVMTTYKAKGREFRGVFLVDAVDEVWGSASRTRGQYLSLPANLSYIRYRGATEDERLRLLYVAMTRAKTHLYMTSYTHTLAGKATTRLKYLDIREEADGLLRSHILPKRSGVVKADEAESVSLSSARSYWALRHQPPFEPPLRKLLDEQLKNYQLSATHVNQFTDITTDGPQAFLIYCLLKFPHARGPASYYGSAVHETIRWVYQSAIRESKMPLLDHLLDQFEELLRRQKLPKLDHELFLERGRSSLSAWLAQRGHDFQPTDKYELNFRNEATFIGDAHLTGVVDRLRINRQEKLIKIIDFKTGRPYRRWVGNNIRLHKYRQQLLFYKLLIENSKTYKGCRVEKGFLEFVEPDEYGQIAQLELAYDQKELDEFKKLLISIWQRVQTLDLPDISNYGPTISGIKAFEKNLISELRD